VLYCAGLVLEVRQPFQRTLPPPSCPFILENAESCGSRAVADGLRMGR
jgi:hypothetical protein